MRAFRRAKRIFYSKQVKKIEQVKDLNVFNKFVFILNIIVVFFLLIACIAPYVMWELFSFLSFLSLVVPFLVGGNILFFCYWLFRRKKQFLMSFMMLLLGYFLQGTFVKFFNSNADTKEGEISILTFNAQSFQGLRWAKNSRSSDEIIAFIHSQDADIVCFQEFDYKKTKNFEQYPYKYVNYIFRKKRYRVVQAIYSKYPITTKGSLDFPNSANNAIYADILIKEDTLRIYNVHLESLKIRPGMLKSEPSDKLFNRLDRSFIKQQEQAKIVRRHRDAISYRSIICGDFNNTQFSSVYNTIKGEMNDTFREIGSGFGRTYNFKFLPFRIDFILTDADIEIKAHKNFKVRLSDHEPIMASFRLRDQ